MRAANRASSRAITASTSFPTQQRTARVISASTCTPSNSVRVNYGERRLRRAIPSTSTCGTTILSAHDSDVTLDSAPELPRLPRDEGGPAFAEPWQAQAFAMAVSLSQQGYFTWKEWATTLADELKAAADRGEPDDGSRYYEHWLAALERLVSAKRLTNPSELHERT